MAANLEILPYDYLMDDLYDFIGFSDYDRDFLVKARETRLPALYEMKRQLALQTLDRAFKDLANTQHAQGIAQRIPRRKEGRAALMKMHRRTKIKAKNRVYMQLNTLIDLFSEAEIDGAIA